MFISDKIESVTPTGISFNPRFQVELLRVAVFLLLPISSRNIWQNGYKGR